MFPTVNSHVQNYYDRNTARFLRYGHGRSAGAIHRAVWGPGVGSRDEAMGYVNSLIAERAGELGATSALDAGCGVGGTMATVAAAGVPRVEGITISTVQQRSGEQFLAERLGSSEAQWRIHAGDFCDAGLMASLVRNRGAFDLAYFVESFIHASCAYGVLDSLSRLLSPTGRVLICDDFLAEEIAATSTAEAVRPLREYREGWHVENLGTVSALREAAAARGFLVERTLDLTPYLELGRGRDRLIRALVPLLRALPLPFAWRDNFIGGNAIQECLQKGYVRYCLVELRRNTV
jgi:SAM-dependent methyltransferase